MKAIFKRWSFPALLLLVLTLSFGLLIPRLGFYWDDWPVILTGRWLGTEGFLRFYQFDRPFSAWTYILTFPLLGSRPIFWHIFTLLLRWGTTVAMWWMLKRLWPAQARQMGWAALLFAIYPVFIQQSISVAYSQHWICYLLFFLSLGAMVQAYRSPRWFWPLTALALAASLLQLLTMEYFAGLELLRPLILWFLLSEQTRPTRQRALAVARGWLPYLLVMAGFVIWRLFFLKFPGQEAANPPILLNKILSDPLNGTLRLQQIAIQDIAHLLVTSWSKILAPEALNLQDRFVLFSWAIGVLSAVLVAVYLLKFDRPAEKETGSAWAAQALVLGVIGMGLGMLPVWFTDRQIIVGLYSNRFGLPAMFGTSLVIVALMEMLIRKEIQRIVMVCLLVGLATGAHLRVANDFRWSWAKQTRFYWQMAWRAPSIQPGTAIFSNGEIFPYVGLYSTSAAINLLYLPGPAAEQLPYWFSSLGREYGYAMDEFTGGVPVKQGLRNLTFEGNTKEGIVIYYEPEKHICLEVITPDDANTTSLPALTTAAAANSDLSRILPGPDLQVPVEIFGPEPAHGWCYLYQKAALAQQQNDWQTVVEIGEQARAEGYGPKESGSNTAFEWIPFIEGYAQTGRWQAAQDLSIAAFEYDKRIDSRLCSLWNQVEADTAPSPERAAAANAVREAVQCPEK